MDSIDELTAHPNFPRLEEAIEGAIEGACNLQDQDSLRKLIGHIARPGMLVVEVGSWQGLSTRAIAEAVRPHRGLVYCVDHWLGSAAEPGELECARGRDIFRIFRANMVRHGLWGHIRPMVMPSADAARVFADKTADLVFIDANHRYEQVLRDIQAWLPKVREGGIICGHDYDGAHQGVVRAVQEALPEFRVVLNCLWHRRVGPWLA